MWVLFCSGPPRESPPFCLLLSFRPNLHTARRCTLVFCTGGRVLLLTNLGSEAASFGCIVGCAICGMDSNPPIPTQHITGMMIMTTEMMLNWWVLIFSQRYQCLVFTFKLPVTVTASHTHQIPCCSQYLSLHIKVVFVPSYHICICFWMLYYSPNLCGSIKIGSFVDLGKRLE